MKMMAISADNKTLLFSMVKMVNIGENDGNYGNDDDDENNDDDESDDDDDEENDDDENDDHDP